MSLKDLIVNPNDFVVEKDVIGKGNFGIVSLVHPKHNKNQKIALKIIEVDLDDQDLQKSFMREILIMGGLNHPNLIQLIGFTPPSPKNQIFRIYSKFMPNHTLKDVLQLDESADKSKKILDPTMRSIIVYGIASAMSYLHHKKIVHRDLKPENIFLDEKYRPVLSDFGLSRFCTDDSNMTCKLGTPYFMAPELFSEDDEKVTNKIDVYAYALTLLSFFTINYKFVGRQPKSMNQLIEIITNGTRYQIPKNTPDFYRDLIQSCWSHNCDDRPSFDDILELLDSGDFIFKGADKEKVREYMDKIKAFESYERRSKSTDSKNVESLGSNKSSSSYEETTEFDFTSKK